MNIYRKELIKEKNTSKYGTVDNCEIGFIIFKDSYVEDRTPFSNTSVEIIDIDSNYLEIQWGSEKSDLEYYLSDFEEIEELEDGYEYYIVATSKFTWSEDYFALSSDTDVIINIISITKTN